MTIHNDQAVTRISLRSIRATGLLRESLGR